MTSADHPRIRLRCLIVDDEPNAVNLLEIFIQQNTSWDLLAKCYDAREALAFLKTHTVDLIFLDINMPHLTGMEMAALLPPSTRIVFTTAYSEFAAESYGFPTIDYLLKPITLKRFYAALQKIEDYFSRPDHQPGAASPNPIPPQSTAQPQPNLSPHPPTDEQYFFVKSGRALQKILLKDILYFEGEKEYVRVVTPVHKLLVYRRLKDIEEQLSASFARVHNSYIVNLARLESIRDNQVFVGGKQIPISEKFREAFMNRIKERVF
ncbi:MAG TPA: LytTR family DNA-binding domain-containing protein [Puia sp.]|jgi:DNA-binding LytR/AlgR family response regulator|nr:LytTR family DNA-binding domain-containing protein [Puia sp.]